MPAPHGSSSSSAPGFSLPGSRPGARLTGRRGTFMLAALLVGICGFALGAVAPLGSRPAGETPAASPALARDAAPSRPLAGFQRRGGSLVGEVCARDGTAMRLVLDARTHTLLGLSVLEAGHLACPPAARPLPPDVRAAN